MPLVNSPKVFTYDRGAVATSIDGVAIDGSTLPWLGDEIGVVAAYSMFRLPDKYTWEIIIEGGSYSTLLVILQISLDGLTWYQADSNFGVLTNTMQHVFNRPARYIRANVLNAAVASGSPKLTVQFAL
jgi:hypothetical protein